MSLSVNLPAILVAAFVASASPGPATLAIAETSMLAGRRSGVALALGVATGSLMWSVTAALGLAAVMAASAWALEAMRIAGGLYLLFLAFKSARAAVAPAPSKPAPSNAASGHAAASAQGRAYAKGLAIHLTNPKPILFFGSLYTFGVSAGAPPVELLMVITAVALQNSTIFVLYALLFSSPRVHRAYLRLRRVFEACFAALFAAAGLKMLATRLSL